MRWNLDNLYTAFDSKEFKTDYENLAKEIQKIALWADQNLGDNTDEVQKMEAYIAQNNAFEKYLKLFNYSSLTASVDSGNRTAIKMLDNIENAFTELEKPRTMFKSFLGRVVDLEKKIESSAILKDHAFFLQKLKKESAYMLSEQEEILLAKLQTTGSSAWSKQQGDLTANLSVEITIDGEKNELPLTKIRSFANSADATLRRDAYFAELKAYEKIDRSVAFSLNSIKGEVLTTAKIRGYHSPLEMTLIQSRMQKETLDALLSAMKEFLPVLQKYLKGKAKLFNHKKGLPFYDIAAPIGEVEMKFTYDEAKDFIVKNFNDFSESLGSFAKQAFDKEWIDAEIRSGKRGGAFCANLHAISESRIMSNFDGSFGQVSTLAHELGHAYHGNCLKDQTYLNSRYTMPIAETASTFCETIIAKAALKTASEAERKIILENELQELTQIIMDIYSRFLFEDEVFKQRENGPLSVTELKELMTKAQIAAYGDGLDPELLHPYMWVCKPHYYSASINYYNFPYAYGLLFAKGLYALYLEKGEAFIPLYDELLRNTGKNDLEDVAKAVGIDVTSKAFWISGLKAVEAEVETFLQ